MKRTWNKICAGIIACVTCWSCNDWLDVDSSTTVTQEQLYGSYEVSDSDKRVVLFD